MGMVKTNNEIEELKLSWKRDPIWDLEDTEGFEDYRGELKAYSENCNAQWEERAKKEHDRLTAKVCPLILFPKTGYGYEGSQQAIYENSHCLVEGCAFWNDNLGVCGAIVPGYLAGIEVARAEAKS